MNQGAVMGARKEAARPAMGPSYRKLISERRRLAWSLSAFVLAVYYVFVYVVAFRPAWLAIRIGDSAISVGFPVALGMFVVFPVLTAFYSHRANSRFDELTRQAIKEIDA